MPKQKKLLNMIFVKSKNAISIPRAVWAILAILAYNRLKTSKTNVSRYKINMEISLLEVMNKRLIILMISLDLSPLPLNTSNFIYKVCPMSSFSVEWNIVEEIVQEFLNLNKAMGLDRVSQETQGLLETCMKSRADWQFFISWDTSQVTAVFKKWQ